MNLLSCNNCGTVLDKNKLPFPLDIENEEGVDDNKAGWDGEDFVAKVRCPVCKNYMLETD